MDRQKANTFAQIRDLLRAQKWMAAQARAETALKQYPFDYMFLEALGVAQLNQRKHDDALRTFRKAVKKAPKNETAYRNLAQAQLKSGALADAHGSILKALKLRADIAESWRIQGDIYLEKGNFEKAIESYKKAARLGPDNMIVAIKLLSTLEKYSKFDDLDATLANYEKTTPDHPVIKLYRGIMHYHAKAWPQAKAALESIGFRYGKRDPLRDFEVLRTRFLGLACDKMHMEADAFSHFTRAKALNRNLHKNAAPPSVFQGVCAMRKAYFKPGVMAKWGTRSAFADEPVFLVGFPRSGTTLLDTFLGGHPEISVLEEKSTVADMRIDLGTQAQNSIEALDKVDEAVLTKARATFLNAQKRFGAKGLVIDKLPMNLVFAGEILRVFPRAKFIFALRDPADSVLSCFMQTFRLNPPMAALDSPLDAAKTYALAQQTWKNIQAECAPAVVTVRYEHLLADKEAALKPVFDFLGIGWDESILDHQSSALERGHIPTPSRTQVVKPLYTSAKGRWKRYAALMPEALEILAPWQKEFGYSD